MYDGSEKLVEDLVVGDMLAGIDGDPEVIEEIQSAISPVLRIQTEGGFTTRNSRVHAFALPGASKRGVRRRRLDALIIAWKWESV